MDYAIFVGPAIHFLLLGFSLRDQEIPEQQCDGNGSD
jgi:hypothetical protein